LKLTRGGRLSGNLTKDVASLTSSSEHDMYIADDVVEINVAHVLMLVRSGIIHKAEGRSLVVALREMLGKIRSIPPDMEDVHMVVEDEVMKRVGPDVGGKIHTGKSRNDQVATALRMRLRAFLIDICENLMALQEVLLKKASSNVEVIMPGFTHMQHAQPTTVAHYLLAYFDMFKRDLDRLLACYSRVNLSPMGSAALAGTGYRLDRHLMAEYLGFDGLVENTIDGVASRDFALEAVSSLSILMMDASRLAEEIVIWASQEFGYIELPDDHSSTSSIMPQKKNPVTAEILRARCGDVLGELTSMVTIMKALPLTYNLDMQELTPHLWRACEASSLSLRVLIDLMAKIEFNENRLKEVVLKDFSVATELADTLVREGHLPFRRAHQVVGEMVRELYTSSSSLSEERPKHLAEMILKKTGVRMRPEPIRLAIDPKNNVNVRSITGGPAFKEVKRMIAVRRRSLSIDKERTSETKRLLKKRRESMYSALSVL
jgi:argininosuccinate lyase